MAMTRRGGQGARACTAFMTFALAPLAPARPATVGGEPSGASANLRARFVGDAVATYGSAYRNLRYRTSVVGRRVEGDRATPTVADAGSVVEILTARMVEASGEAEAESRWYGCRWLRTGLRY